MTDAKPTIESLQAELEELRRQVAGGGPEPPRPPEAPPGYGPDSPGDFARPTVVSYLLGRARFWRRKEREWTRPRAREDARLLALVLEELAETVRRGSLGGYSRGDVAALLQAAARDWRLQRVKAHRARERYDARIVAEELEKLAVCALETKPVEVG